MGCLQVSAVIGSFLSFVLLLTALATDHWVGYADHTGLWQVCEYNVCRIFGSYVQDYIHATRGFMVLGALTGAISFFGLCASFCQPLVGSVSTTKIAAIASFTAGTCALLAMSVFTGVYVDLYSSRTDDFFGWSFALGWVSGPLFLATGGLAYNAHPGACGPTFKVVSIAVI